MIVKELMKKLEKFPEDAPIVVISDADCIFDISYGDEVEQVICAMTENNDREMEQMVFLKY